MPKLTSPTYRIRGSARGISTITFYGEKNKTFDIEFPSMGLMALSDELRRAAEGSLFEVGRYGESGGHRSLSAGTMTVEDTDGDAPLRTQYGVAVAADLSLILTWFNVPTGEKDICTRCEIGLSLGDTERLIGGLTHAVAGVKSLTETIETKH